MCVFFLFKHFVVVFSLSDHRKADRRYYMYIIVGGYPRRAIRGGGGGGARERSRFPSLFYFVSFRFVCLAFFSTNRYPYLPMRLFFFLFVSLSPSRTPHSRSLLPARRRRRRRDGPNGEFRRAPAVVARTDAAEHWAGAHRGHRSLLFHKRIIRMHAHL